MRMIAQPDHLTVRPNLGAAATMDPLAEVLRSVRLAGGVFLSAHFTAPWCIEVRIEPADCVRFLRKPTQIISYHVVTEGRLLVALEGEPMIEVDAGEIVIFPQNAAHTLANEPGIEPVSANLLIQQSSDGGLNRISHGGGGAPTHIVCGFLASEENYHPLLSTLPKALKVDVRRGASREWIEASVRFAAGELADGKLASSGVMSRLSEVAVDRGYTGILIDRCRRGSRLAQGSERPADRPRLGLDPSQGQRTLVGGNSRAGGCTFPERFCRAIYVARRHAADQIPHRLAASDRQAEVARDEEDNCPVGGFRRVQIRGSIQPGFQAGVRAVACPVERPALNRMTIGPMSASFLFCIRKPALIGATERRRVTVRAAPTQ